MKTNKHMKTIIETNAWGKNPLRVVKTEDGTFIKTNEWETGESMTVAEVFAPDLADSPTVAKALVDTINNHRSLFEAADRAYRLLAGLSELSSWTPADQDVLEKLGAAIRNGVRS